MAWKCPTCGDEFGSFRGYANHYNLSSDHSGNALADAVGCETLADLYATMSENAVAEELGVTRPAVKGALESCGISRRGQSEAEQLKYEQMSEEERRELTESARDEIREKYGDGGFLGQWVSDNPDDHAEVAREAAALGTPAREENGMAGVTGQDHPDWRGGKSVYDAVKKQLRPAFSTVKDDARSEECSRCGVWDCKLDVHHIIPIMAGGTNEEWNLMTLCESCHSQAEWFTRQYSAFDPVLVE